MAVAYLNYSVRTRTSATSTTWTHTPSSTPSATVCLIGSYQSDTNRVVSVTYGGIALTKIVEAVDTAGEPMRTQIWALTTGVPSGAQTVVITFSDSTSARHVCYVTSWSSALGSVRITASGVDEGDQTDPAIALSVGGVESMAVGLLLSGHNSETSLTALSGNTVIWAENYFNQCWQLLRQTTASTSDHTIGSTATSEDTAFAAISMTETIAEVPGVGSVTVTGNAPTVTVPVWIGVPAGALTFTGDLPSITSVGKTPDTGVVTLAGEAPGLSYVLTVGVGAVAVQGLPVRLPSDQLKAPGWARRYYPGYGAYGTGTTSITLSNGGVGVGGPVEDGDILIMALSHKDSAGWATLPAGWTAISQQQLGTLRVELHWKRASGEGASYAVTGMGSSVKGVLWAYSGGIWSGDPIDDVAAQVGGSWLHSDSYTQVILTNGVVTTEEDDLIITVVANPSQLSLTNVLTTNVTEASGNRNIPPDENFNPLHREQYLNNASGSLWYHNGTFPWVGAVGGVGLIPTYWLAEGIVIQVALKPERLRTRDATATKYYLTWGNHPQFLPDYGASDGLWQKGDWDGDIYGPQNFGAGFIGGVLELSQQKIGGGTSGYYDSTKNAETPGSTETITVRELMHTYITPPLAAQTIDCDLNIVATTYFETSYPDPPLDGMPDHDVYWALHVYVSQGDTWDVREVLLDNWTDTAPWEPVYNVDGKQWYTTWALRSFGTVPHLGPFAIQAGDRIFIELGYQLVPNGPYPDQVQPPEHWVRTNIPYGTEIGTLAVRDTTPTTISVESSCAYLSFGQILREQGNSGTVPSNTTYQTATVITTLPYSDVSNTTLIGTDIPMRPLWYRWTAPSNLRVFCYTYDTTYQAEIEVFDDESVPLTSHRNNGPAQNTWDDGYTPIYHWDAVSGETYYIRVKSQQRKSGGYFKFHLQEEIPLANNDVMVATAGHIFRYTEDGTLAAILADFSSSALSGLAIDYSGAEIVDAYGDTGVSTAPRLLVGVFGVDFISILDLASMGIGETNLDYIANGLYPLDDSWVSTALSSIATDTVNKTTTIYVGWFALDGFRMTDSQWASFMDRADSTGESNVVVTDVTHGDNQPTEPVEGWEADGHYTTAVEAGGTNYIELNPAGTELWYTSGGWYRPVGGQTIKRWDLVNNVQLPDFVTVPEGPGPNPGLKGLFPLPATPTTPTGGCLVCNGGEVIQYDGAGNIVWQYQPTPAALSLMMTDVELQSDGAAFWVYDSGTNTLFKFDMETKAQLATVRIGMAALGGTSLVIYREEAYPPSPDANEGTQTGGGGIVLDGSSGSGTGTMTATRPAGCIIFETCPMGTLEDECPPADCVTICLSPEQEQLG